MNKAQEVLKLANEYKEKYSSYNILIEKITEAAIHGATSIKLFQNDTCDILSNVAPYTGMITVCYSDRFSIKNDLVVFPKLEGDGFKIDISTETIKREKPIYGKGLFSSNKIETYNEHYTVFTVSWDEQPKVFTKRFAQAPPDVVKKIEAGKPSITQDLKRSID